MTERAAAKKMRENDPAFNTAKFSFFSQDFGMKLSFRQAFLCLFVVRSLAAFTSPVRDCDETFNYWEPTHYLLYGFGLQTWEYSPVFALRSYAYVLLHVILGQTLRLFVEVNDKVVVFYLIRWVLGICSAFCEAFFFSGVSYRFGKRAGWYTLVFCLFSTGMYFSSVAYLPSSFAMYAVMLAFGAWFRGMHGHSIIYAAVGVLLSCWPFVAVVFLPLSFDALNARGIPTLLVWTIKVAAYIVVPVILVDSFFYGEWGVFAAFNMIKYNVLRDNSLLYGVEDWKYYFLNGFLNFSVVFPIALMSFALPCCAGLLGVEGLVRRNIPKLTPWRLSIYLSPFYIWFFIMQTRPHKEERFLYVVYPLIALSGALVMDMMLRLAESWESAPKVVKITARFGNAFAIFLFLILSVSRSMHEVIHFRAPLQLYRHLYHVELERHIQSRSVAHDEDRTVIVCVGKEWYRFPTSFFLSSNTRLNFIDDGFKGQLPQPFFEVEGGTRLIPNDMNDMNREETSRYIPSEECHYLVDVDVHTDYDQNRWDLIFHLPFLNVDESPKSSRIFYIPFYSKKRNKYFKYMLLKNKDVVIPTHKHIHHRKVHKPYVAEVPTKPAVKKRTGLSMQVLKHMVPGLIDVSRMQQNGDSNILFTKAGKDGYWNRKITEENPRLLWVYGENHRDFLKMKPWFDRDHGELRPQAHFTHQKTTQGNIRGEPNAFPIRTMWYHTIPGSDQYQNWFADKELAINMDVIAEDIDRIIEAWKHGTYDFIVFGHRSVGTGVADLPRRAPNTYAFLTGEIDRLKSTIDADGSRVISLMEHAHAEEGGTKNAAELKTEL